MTSTHNDIQNINGRLIESQSQDKIQSRIYTIRGVQVMLDRDLADCYGVTTGALNQAVKRNISRFPERFMFQMTQEEFENWKSQIVITNSMKMSLRRTHIANHHGNRINLCHPCHLWDKNKTNNKNNIIDTRHK